MPAPRLGSRLLAIPAINYKDINLGAAVFFAERHETNVGQAKIIEDALADFAVAGMSGENLEGTTVALTRRIGESYSHEPIDDCEIAAIRIVLAVRDTQYVPLERCDWVTVAGQLPV